MNNSGVKCFADTVHFKNKTMYGKKPYTYNWSLAFHANSNLANPVYKYNTPGTFIVNMKVTDALGCKDSIQHTVINPAPVIANFTADSTVNKGDTLHVTNMVLGFNLTYKWYVNNVFYSSNVNPVIIPQDTGIYTIKLTVTNNFGCTGSTQKTAHVKDSYRFRIFGTLYENPECSGLPVPDDTLVLKDNTGIIISTVSPTITNSNGEFTFNPAQLATLDTSALYTLATKSGYELKNISLAKLSQWTASSPMNLDLNNNKKEWLSIYQHLPSLQNLSTKCDLSDNLYVFGYTTIDSYNEKALLLKYNTATGDLMWQQEFFPIQNTKCRSNDMVIDQNGNIYLSCIYNSNSVNSNWDNIYLLKFSPDGTMQWSRNYGFTFDKKDYVNIELDNTGNIIVSAVYYIRSSNLLFLKYDPSGNLLNSQIFDFGGSEYVKDMKVVGNNIYFTGADNLLNPPKGKPANGIITYSYNPVNNSMTGSTYLTYNGNDKGENMVIDQQGNVYVVGCINNNQIFVMKYDQYFNQQWMYYYNELKAFDWAYSSIRLVDGNLYIGSYTTNGGVNGFTLFKLSLQGNLIWSDKYNTPLYFTKDYYWVLMDNDNQNNIYMSGAKWNGVDHDIFTIKYLPDGNRDWVATTIYPNNEGPTDMLVSPNNNIYFTGISRVLPTFDKILTAKYSQCPSTASAMRYNGTYTQIPGITNTTETEELETSSVNERSRNAEFVQMFPNPNDGNFYFNYSLPENEICRFAVLDQLGKKIYDIEIKGGRNTVMINSNDFSNGVYYYQITAGKRLIKTEKLVITK